MAKKKKSGGGGGSKSGGEPEMPAGDMNQPVSEGLMEMPHGGETQTGSSPSSGGRGMDGGLMPGEASGEATGEGDMPDKRMTST